MLPEVIIRADGGPLIGMGHLVRSFSLAKALTDLGVNAELWGLGAQRASLLDSTFHKVSFRELPEHHYEVRDFENYLDGQAPLIITDGYFFPTEFYKALDERNISYGVIDDNGETQATSPAFIVNQNPSAAENLYRKRYPAADLLVGLDFALIRGDIARFADYEPIEPEYEVFVGFGGSDPLMLTLPISRCLVDNGFTVAAVVGPGVARRKHIVRQLDRLQQVTTFRSEELPLALYSSEVAILAAGSSLWESMSLRKPTLGLVIAENQLEPARAAFSEGIIQAFLDVRKPRPLTGRDSCAEIVALIRGIKKVPLQKRVLSASTRNVANYIKKVLHRA